MKIEKINRLNQKYFYYALILGVVLLITLCSIFSYAKYQNIEDIKLVEGNINYKPYDFKMMAMYKSDDGTDYTEIDKTPGSNYKINEEKSYCTINNVDKDNTAKIYTDRFGHHVFNNLSKNSKCYVWFDKNTEVVNTVLGNIEVNNYTPDFSETATTDEGIFKAEDNDGVSYYWRGAATTNYVKFGGYCWRIVRINGDGTIRLIYDGTTCHNNGEATTDSIALSNEYYTTADGLYFNSSYVGWTYTENLQRPINNYEATPSHVKTIVEEWYNNRLISYEDKIATSKYCNDRDLTIDSIYSGTGTPFNYAGSKRIHNDFKPQLNCNKDDTYKLKVGLITADEVALAGGTNGDNKDYYLYNGQNYWTMTPYFWENTWGFARVFFINDYGKIAYNGVYFNEAGIRPVINLKVDAPVTGNGTINSPYLI